MKLAEKNVCTCVGDKNVVYIGMIEGDVQSMKNWKDFTVRSVHRIRNSVEARGIG